jgi:hypothetical protein
MGIIENKIENILTQIKENELINDKSVLSEESKSQSCNKYDSELYRVMFSVNPNVKWMFRKAIDSVLKKILSEYYYDEDPTGQGQMPGFYNLESDDRSVINKLNTNYSCFCILVKDINKVLISRQIEPINFLGKSPKQQEVETMKLIKYIEAFGDRIFKTNSDTFKNLMNTLNRTHTLGEKRETDTLAKLKKKFGENNVVKIGGLGSKEDMIQGIDITVNMDGKEYTAQVKPFSKLINYNGSITAIDTGNVKKYTTDWLIFTNNTATQVFDNKNTKIIDGNYVFPESALIYSL